MPKILQNKKGFSMMELIVAIFIITTALTAILGLAHKSIQAQKVNENVLVASMLAQEGLELVRNLRDTNWQEGNSWNTGINNNIFGIDYLSIYNDKNNIDDAFLYFDSFGFYTHDSTSGNLSPFKRIIRIEDINDPEVAKVDCVVSWNERGRKQEYIASVELYDWWQ